MTSKDKYIFHMSCTNMLDLVLQHAKDSGLCMFLEEKDECNYKLFC